MHRHEYGPYKTNQLILPFVSDGDWSSRAKPLFHVISGGTRCFNLLHDIPERGAGHGRAVELEKRHC